MYLLGCEREKYREQENDSNNPMVQLSMYAIYFIVYYNTDHELDRLSSNIDRFEIVGNLWRIARRIARARLDNPVLT